MAWALNKVVFVWVKDFTLRLARLHQTLDILDIIACTMISR